MQHPQQYDYASLCVTLGLKGFVQGEEYRARCPFHSDTNPSFSVNVVKGLWICHRGCGSGDFHSLVERILGCSFQEAREWIYSSGRKSSVDVLSRELSKELGQLPGVVPVAAPTGWLTYYRSLDNKAMPLWFLKRGFTWPTIIEWGLKYDPVRDAVVIPVRWENELVGIISRPLIGLPKYQNSTGLPRSEIFFGRLASKDKAPIICEGVLDALWLIQLGYNAVALLGTYMSLEQAAILKRHHYGEITLALDNDDAGRKGTQDTVQRLLHAGWILPQLKLIKFPLGIKDPQDCTEELFEELFSKREDVFLT